PPPFFQRSQESRFVLGRDHDSAAAPVLDPQSPERQRGARQRVRGSRDPAYVLDRNRPAKRSGDDPQMRSRNLVARRLQQRYGQPGPDDRDRDEQQSRKQRDGP